jgi:hypothetical protein
VIIDFFVDLGYPMGFDDDMPKLMIAKEVASMRLYYDETNHLYFHNVLYAAMKRAIGTFKPKINKTLVDELLLKLIQRSEVETKNKIRQIIAKQRKKTSSLYGNQRKEFIAHSIVQNSNPFFSLMILRHILREWNRYTQEVKQ